MPRLLLPPSRHEMEGNTAQIIDDLLQVKALGAAHLVLSTQTNEMARFQWEIDTLAREMVPRVH